MNYLYTILAFSLVYAVLALGLNLQMGYTGIVNFGYVAFVAIGAYTSALLTVEHGWPVLLAWAAAAVLAAVASYPLGLMTIRLGGDYLAIVTLGFSQLVVLFLTNQQDLTRGAIGITGIKKPFAEAGPDTASVLAVILLALVVVGSALLLWRMSHSPLGRLLRAIQTNEAAAQALGKDTVSYKILALVIGSGMAGLAGAMYAHWVQYISPEQFTPDFTFNTFIALILGGVGSLVGPVVGAFVLMIFFEGSVLLQDYITFISPTQFAAGRFMLVGVVLVLLILFRPSGIMGKKVGS